MATLWVASHVLNRTSMTIPSRQILLSTIAFGARWTHAVSGGHVGRRGADEGHRLFGLPARQNLGVRLEGQSLAVGFSVFF